MNELALKYGCNPNQKPSRIYMEDGSDLPVTVLNGKPGYINFLDALNSIQLVKELKAACGLPAAVHGAPLRRVRVEKVMPSRAWARGTSLGSFDWSRTMPASRTMPLRSSSGSDGARRASRRSSATSGRNPASSTTNLSMKAAFSRNVP